MIIQFFNGLTQFISATPAAYVAIILGVALIGVTFLVLKKVIGKGARWVVIFGLLLIAFGVVSIGTVAYYGRTLVQFVFGV